MKYMKEMLCRFSVIGQFIGTAWSQGLNVG